MHDQEMKKGSSSADAPAQQTGDVPMSSSEVVVQTTAILSPVNDNSTQVSSSEHGCRISSSLALAAVQNPTDPTDGSAQPSQRNAVDDHRLCGSAKDSPLPRVSIQVGNPPRACKRKKDSLTGSSNVRPRDASLESLTERSNSTSSPPRSPRQLVQTRLSLHPGSCMPSQASQPPFSHISSADHAQSGNLTDSLQNAQAGCSQSADPAARRAQVRAWGNQPLAVVDAALWEIMEREKLRQWRGIELIASENFVSQAVIEALGSHLTNKYSEGLPGSRYYGGNEHIDMIESLCISRALAAFHLDPREWGVNVQPYSCTSANFAVYTALLQPKDRIMGLDVPSGGHVSHGYYTASGKKVSGASIFFESLPFKVNPQNGLIDFDTLQKFAMNYRPKILICGGSAYPREWDYGRFRDIANKCGAVLMCDMAHISGLIAAKECANPFDYCDIVTSTTHKILRGPRGGIIFYRKGPRPRRCAGPDTMYDFEDRINFAVHPSLQGGPHNNHIAALAVALKQVATPEYQQYIRQVKKNAHSLASALMKRGCVLVTGGTDNHLLLWDLRNRGLTGNRLEKVCEMCHMTVNKNAVLGDSSALGVGGVRLGTPAMTSRGCVEEDFEVIADLLMKAAQIAESVQSEHGKLQKDFVKGLQCNKEIVELRKNVEKFASMFEMPGFEVIPKNFSQ